MRVTRYGLLAATFCIVQPTFAADMPTKAPPAPVPIYSWSGCYIGPQIGYAWTRDELTETVTATGAISAFTPTSAAESRGFKAGGMLGCNWQFAGTPWVIGIEGDGEGADIFRGTAGYPGSVPPDFYEARIDWQASIRGRLGYAFDKFWIFDHTLLYATGGAAWANIEHIYTAGGLGVESFSSTQDGWTVGGGAEFAFLTNWTLRVEYRYADFGSVTNVPVLTFTGFTERHELTEHAVRFGLAYKFWTM